MTEADLNAPDAAASRVFARKVRLSAWALFFERLWPRLWVLIGIGAAFAALSLLGVWPHVPALAHQFILALFSAAALGAIVFAVRVPWPAREDAVRRIERRSGVAHRPASSYEDQLSAQTSNPETAVLWQAHRERLTRAIERLKVGTPSPRADRFDPLAVRSLALLLLLPAAALVTGSFSDRFASAFRFGAGDGRPGTRVDAWVTPPPYTAMPPVLLADGSEIVAKPDDKAKMFEVPERSLLTLRGTGFGSSGVSLEILSDGATTPVKVASDPPKAGDTTGLAELRYEIRKSALVRALSGSSELAHWTFSVIPDQLPKITLDTKAMDRTPRGSMKLNYKAEDDYGVASASAKVRQLKPKAADPSKAWAQAPVLKGPRLPLERPPILTLKMPRAGSKAIEGSTLLELGSHPWAGQRVELWLEATDVAGQIGKSTPVEMVLPSRRFNKPLARAVIEQRRKLSEDSRNRPAVARALAALTLEPEGFIETNGIYLGLRSVYYRLEREATRASLKESVEQLWQLALSIEDGKLSDAEGALKEAQDKLSEALQKGADDKEIDKLIAELKAKLKDYLAEMQKNAAKDQDNADSQQDDEQQELGQQDLDQMMQDLEKNAKEGSREDAEKVLSDLRELMDKLQAETKESRAENQRAKDMMKKLNQLSDLADKQRKLLDDTFDAQKKQQDQAGQEEGGEQNDDSGKQSKNSKQGKQGKGGQKSDKGGPPDEGGGQDGENQNNQDGQGVGERQKDKGNLQDRQAQLRKQLDQLKKDLDQMGAGDPDKLGKADEAMGKAEEGLEKKDFEEAAEQQGEAIEQMRQSAQQMSQQIQKNAQQKMGRGGDTPKDPLGRPQRAQGPDQGTSVKVPNAIDAQRAREILEELRKRSGESLRPPSELDYIDRLLKRF